MDDAREFTRRLAELLRREHAALGDFLVALAEFDERQGFAQLGYANLFDFLHRELKLSRGAAHYRRVAARLVREYPEVIEPLRDGRLCLSTVSMLQKVITPGNRAEMLPRFFHRSKQEARAIAAEIRPAEVVARREVVTCVAGSDGRTTLPVHPDELPLRTGLAPQDRSTRMESTDPLTSDLRRLHVTVTKQFIAKLEQAKAGQSHVQADASAEQVLEAALDLLLAAQEKRRASVPPRVKREVLRRDGRKCQWPTHDGGICGSQVRVQIDHIVPRGKGGASTVENCRVLCAIHNQEAARRVYGDPWMDQFAREPEAEYRVSRTAASAVPRSARRAFRRFDPPDATARCQVEPRHRAELRHALLGEAAATPSPPPAPRCAPHPPR